MSDPGRTLLTLPIRGVFALHVREHEQTLLVRLVGCDDEDAVFETHFPVLPNTVEVNGPPWRRASAPQRNLT